MSYCSFRAQNICVHRLMGQNHPFLHTKLHKHHCKWSSSKYNLAQWKQYLCMLTDAICILVVEKRLWIGVSHLPGIPTFCVESIQAHALWLVDHTGISVNENSMASTLPQKYKSFNISTVGFFMLYTVYIIFYHKVSQSQAQVMKTSNSPNLHLYLQTLKENFWKSLREKASVLLCTVLECNQIISNCQHGAENQLTIVFVDEYFSKIDIRL